MSQLDFLCWPHQVLFLFCFYLAKEADGPNFKPKLLVRVPKVSQHDIDDWNLINFRCVNLHHSLSIALPHLQRERQHSSSASIYITTEANAINQTSYLTHPMKRKHEARSACCNMPFELLIKTQKN